MDPIRSSCWDSIVEKVKPHLPTIDFNSPSSENEETNSIYERPAGLSLELLDDFNSFSLDDDELQELVKPATCGHGVELDDDDVTPALQWGNAALHCDADAERAAVEFNRPQLEPNVQETKSNEGFPVLSFERLDRWDLDVVIHNLKEDALPQYVSAEHPKKYAGVDKDRSNGEIMEKLYAFSNSQLSKAKAVENPNQMIQSNVLTKPVVRAAAELLQSQQECSTVYIDLRCPDPSTRRPRTSPNLSSESPSPAKHNTHQEAPPTKKHNLRVNAGSQAGDREVSGKSLLLQKTREMKEAGKVYPNKSTDPLKELKDEIPPRTCSPESDHLWEDKHVSSHVQYRNAKIESPQGAQQSATRQSKQWSDQQRAQQILKQLEIHRPTESGSQKQQAAEQTDVLYDVEASHLQSISTVPSDIEGRGCMLLIVNLSSPGMVVDRWLRRRKHLCPDVTKSQIYNILVAWFLSLVRPDSPQDEDEDAAKVPFWVAGLQQLWTEDGLALHVLAVARHCYKPMEKKKDIHAPFFIDVSRFLSKTSLTLISSNLRNRIPPIHLPSSRLSCFISATSSKKVIERTFAPSPGFYWQTVETQEHVCEGREVTPENTEVSVAMVHKGFHRCRIFLQRILDYGLDVCGLRLLYPPQKLLSDSACAVPVEQRTEEICKPVLAIAVRGPDAHAGLQICAEGMEPYGFIPLQLATQVHKELCLWFSGRLQEGSAQDPTWPLNRALPLDDKVRGLSRSPSFLCATTKADLLLVVSPAVSPCNYGRVLSFCASRGFRLMGLKRTELHSSAATILGLTYQQALLFCRPNVVIVDQKKLQLPRHCLVLLLRKENAKLHSAGLPAALMTQFEVWKLLDHIHSGLGDVHTVEPSFCFHTVSYSNSSTLNIFVNSMWDLPDPFNVILSHQRYSSSSNTEQVVILTMCEKDMRLGIIHDLLRGPEGKGGFKLLGLKFLPALTRLQALEVTPYEVGERLWHSSLDDLVNSPAIVCALRREDAFASLWKRLEGWPERKFLMSPTPEAAFRQTMLFFFEHELIPDPQMLLTTCLFKPRSWSHTLVKMAGKLRLSGLRLVGLRVLILDTSSAASFLPAEPSDPESHVAFLCSGPSLALCLQGENAVRRLLDVLYQEDSSLWRGCYASESQQKAMQDVGRLFPEGLCCSETSTKSQEQIIHMRSDALASVEHEPSSTVGPGAQDGSLTHRALWQTTCLLIPFNAEPALSQLPTSQLDLLEQLLRLGCHLVAGRMSILDANQRKSIFETLEVSSRKSKKKMARLSGAPCFIMALQGETLVTRFHMILSRIYEERRDLEEVGKTIIYPESETQAKQLMCFLFDALSPGEFHRLSSMSGVCDL